ncbi:fatty acid desaturase family protein [Nesterenkonia sphaerica]|uniref:Acyl-CoA desaturase n=1 Tax=Nesterenkonia sphaerica TaxID=1804988 RepID=A0A5R9A9I8_9MICC|nr:acyl-CoA desaturase [Nesterenkonia sphaerica]TLP74466.1 acyl-CoA desaturase [Nesterenkonia sphaerica]
MTITQDTAPAIRSERRPVRNRQTNDFFELAQRVKEAGLMDRSAESYIGRVIVLALSFIGAGALLVAVGDSWWQLAVAALFGILFTQVAFLAHDAAHQQVFNSGRRNDRLSRIVGNLVVGMSYAWWAKKHGTHHAHPNVIGKDGDISPGTLAFVPEDAEGRTGLAGWFVKRQGWFFFPILMFFGFVLHYHAVHVVLTSEKVKHRKTEGAFLAVRLIGYPALIILLLGPVLGAVFIAVQVAVFGVYMGATFAPNHKGMPLIPKDAKVDFMQRQILTSRNIRGGRVMNAAMGGLNYQIEHHLFPRMASPNLRKVQPLVRQFCAERGITYTETGLIESWGIVIRYLNRVGLGYADPMDCPVTSQFRPR